jgi:hypothetical protein
MIRRSFLTLALGPFILSAAIAQPPRPKTAKPVPAKPPVKNETKAQGQLGGINGQFDTVYTFQNDFNVTLLAARYTVEPFRSYSPLAAEKDQKLFVVDLAVKNTRDTDNGFSPDGFLTVVDDKGNLYNDFTWALTSSPTKSFFPSLRPGQGLGQPALNDAVRAAVVLPGSMRIVKIMVNQGRKGKEEKVLRYYVAGATKAEAGEDGDPKNAVASLPDEVRDATDSSGAVALAEGKGMIGTFLPSAGFAIRLDKFALTDGPLNGNPPDEGKQFAVLTMTARWLLDRDGSFFEMHRGDFPPCAIIDGDGETYKPQGSTGYRKASRDEEADRNFKLADEYTFRVFIPVPKDVSLKKLVIAAGNGRLWSFDPGTLR